MIGKWYEGGTGLLTSAALNYTVDVAAGNILGLLVSSDYVFNAESDGYISDLTGELAGGAYTRGILAGATDEVVTISSVRYRVLGASDLIWFGATFTTAALIIAKHGTTDETSPLICYHPFVDSLGNVTSVTADGGEFRYSFTDGVARIIC